MNIREAEKELIRKIWDQEWSSEPIMSRGRSMMVSDVEGFAAYEGQELLGLITYSVENGSCEIVSLNSFRERTGVGTALIDRVKEFAREQKCQRVWLVTSNDNTDGLTFYQKRGFDMCGFSRNEYDRARTIKPRIPESGNFGIPIRHEIELEAQLESKVEG